MEYVFDVSRQAGLKVVPVTGPVSRRGPGTIYLDAVSRIVARDSRGIAFRMPAEDFVTGAVLKRSLSEMLESTAVDPEDVDLYLDASSAYGTVAGSADEFALIRSLQGAARIALELEVRRLIFVGSSMPGSLVHHGKGHIMHVPRAEYRVWRRVADERRDSRVHFGDYGIVDPSQTEADVPRAPPSRIRATVGDEHRLYKGEPNAIRDVAKQAIEDGAPHGARPSWGAQAIGDCAAGNGGEGNASTWVARDTNMHIENVVTAVAGVMGVDLRSVHSVVREPWLQRIFEFVDRP